MKYVLRRGFTAASDEEISPDEFKILRDARSFLRDYMRFEENVIQLIYAAEEFEKFLLKAALNNDFFPLAEYETLQNTRLRANLRVLGYLHCLTSLRDQFPAFRSVTPPDKVSREFKKIWDEEKARSISFQFCERLRNYAQHQTQPVHSVSLGGGWNEERELREDHASVYVQTEAVCRNYAIPTSEKEAYRSILGAKADISLIFRETLTSVGEVVGRVRAFVGDDFAAGTEAYAKYTAGSANVEDKFLSAVAIDGEEDVEQFDVFVEFLQRIRNLRNTFLPRNKARHFVSNRARGHQP